VLFLEGLFSPFRLFKAVTSCHGTIIKTTFNGPNQVALYTIRFPHPAIPRQVSIIGVFSLVLKGDFLDPAGAQQIPYVAFQFDRSILESHR
jgi:hypothetical protein